MATNIPGRFTGDESQLELWPVTGVGGRASYPNTPAGAGGSKYESEPKLIRDIYKPKILSFNKF